MSDPHRIRTEAELREVIPEPNAVIEQKIFDHVDEFASAFIRKAPLLLMATAGADGGLDVSPKGDAAGFVQVEDEKTLVIPDRPGNKLTYGFRNILANPAVGLIFVVPGVVETLRVNGRAEITRDPVLLERLSARHKPAVLATRVRVEESFFHCGKAFVRSSLWKPATWPEGVKANIGKQIAKRNAAGDDLAEAIEKGLAEDLKTGL
jgi:PPOX class probable FMN-dependent enzyme